MTDLILYRALNPVWSFAPLSGAGAARQGGRWNRPNQPALYLAFDAITAMLEYNQTLEFHPVTLVEYYVEGATLADLTDPASCAGLGIDTSLHSQSWYDLVRAGNIPPQWPVGDRLQALWIDGVIYPSMQNPIGKALCLWNWNTIIGPCVTLFDSDHRLPRDQQSWITTLKS
jgi:RES domain-containing protein